MIEFYYNKFLLELGFLYGCCNQIQVQVTAASLSASFQQGFFTYQAVRQQDLLFPLAALVRGNFGSIF